MSQQPGSESSSVKHKVETPPDEALKYWTVDKKRKARPAPQPRIGNPGREQSQSSRPPQAPDAQKS